LGTAGFAPSEKGQSRRTSNAVLDRRPRFASYYDDGHSVYHEELPRPGAAGVAVAERPSITTPSGSIDIQTITQTVLDQLLSSPTFAEQVASQIKGSQASSRSRATS